MDDQSAPRIFDALRRYGWSSLAIVVVTFLLSLLFAVVTSNGDSVLARIVPKMPDRSSVQGTGSPSESSFVRYVKQQALFTTSDRVLRNASDQLGRTEPVSDLRDMVVVDAAEDGESLTVTVNGNSQEQATRIANAIVKAYQQETQKESQADSDAALNTIETQRQKVIDSIPDRRTDSNAGTVSQAASTTLAELDTQAAQIRLAQSQFGDGVSFVDQAGPANTGSPLRDGAIGIVLGGLIAGGVAWLRADRDRRIAEVEDISEIIEGPLLAEIEVLAGSSRSGLHDLSVPPLRPYRFAASGLRTVVGRGVVVVTGCEVGDGCTTTTLQLASAAARDGARVLVVDAVTGSHELSDILGLHHDPLGITALATGASSLDQCARPIYLGTNVAFWAVPAGQYGERALDYLQSTRLEKAIMDMRAHYDLVLVDSAPLTNTPEITPIIRQSDGVVVVVKRDGPTRALRNLRDRLALFGGSVTGFVFTFAGASRNGTESEPQNGAAPPPMNGQVQRRPALPPAPRR